MTASTRIYAGGAIAFGGQPVINDLLNAGYNTVIVWSVHVAPDGSLILNNTQIVSGGVYQEAEPMDLPARLAQLYQAGVEIIFSVGAYGTCDFTTINMLLGGQTGGPGNVLYENFKALKEAMVAAGGDIDAIDFDNEDYLESGVMINFANTLASAGYGHVTFCPYEGPSIWYDTMKSLVDSQGNGFVNAIHLQCYSGGSGNVDIVSEWVTGFKNAGGSALMIPGLATNQSSSGWWYKCGPGSSVKTVPNVAMYEGANWDNYLYTQNLPTAESAMWKAPGGATFFFYCREPLILTNGRSFNTGDAVYFTGAPWWGSAPQCDAYYLSGPCDNSYNPLPGACPSDLQSQYQTWGSTVDGGFIWFYDSIISCLLSTCCGGSIEQPVGTALAYREAITNGLS